MHLYREINSKTSSPWTKVLRRRKNKSIFFPHRNSLNFSTTNHSAGFKAHLHKIITIFPSVKKRSKNVSLRSSKSSVLKVPKSSKRDVWREKLKFGEGGEKTAQNLEQNCGGGEILPGCLKFSQSCVEKSPSICTLAISREFIFSGCVLNCTSTSNLNSSEQPSQTYS